MCCTLLFSLCRLLCKIVCFFSVWLALMSIDSDIWPIMKRILLQIVNLLMAFVVLLSSTGFGLVEHSCQMRGKKKTVVTAFSDAQTHTGCAGDDAVATATDQTTVKKVPCCQDEQQFENVDTKASLTQLVAKFVKAITETVMVGVVTLLRWVVGWIFDTETSIASASPAPPSLSGRDILTLVHSLLI